jgi:hypothetical protein
VFWIDGTSYPVESAELVAEVDERNRRVSFSLYIECRDQETGLSINNLSLPGTTLAGAVVRLAEDQRDEFNDLSQSEVSFQATPLRLRNLFLRLGSPVDDKISIDLTASCAPFDAAEPKDHNLRVAGQADLKLETGL